LANLFTKSPKLILPNTRASATHVIVRIIVHDRVACSAHVFAKLKFANNILDQFANFNARQNNRLYGMMLLMLDSSVGENVQSAHWTSLSTPQSLPLESVG